MKYIWINPVVEKMYESKLDILKNNLRDIGYSVVSVSGQVKEVKNKFKKVIRESKETVLDTRCPLALGLIKDNIDKDNYRIPTIEPILIHTARELYDLYIKNSREEDELIITTPCRALKEEGENLFKNKVGIKFYTWLDICNMLGIDKMMKSNISPIPLGFFRDICDNVLEVSGSEKINKFILNKRYDVIEMLYCPGGCNNGDGV